MTKILSVLSSRMLCQASDRLVSTGRDHYDRLANKTLVYIARDAIAFISYSGSAYLEGLPTDEWLARLLTGVDDVVEPLSGHPRGGATWTATRRGRLPQWLDIGQAAILFAKELDDVFPYLAVDEQRIAPSIVIASMKWKRQRPWVWYPFLAVVERRPSVEKYTAAFPPAHRVREPFLICEMPMPYSLEEAERNQLIEAIAQCGSDRESVENELVAGLRAAAAKEPATIGQDCLTVSVAASTADVINVRFHALSARTTLVRRNSDGGIELIPVAYTPWLIAPEIAAPPMAVMGTSEIGLGVARVGNHGGQAFRALIHAPPAPEGSRLAAAMAGAPRKRSPRRQRKR